MNSIIELTKWGKLDGSYSLSSNCFLTPESHWYVKLDPPPAMLFSIKFYPR